MEPPLIPGRFRLSLAESELDRHQQHLLAQLEGCHRLHLDLCANQGLFSNYGTYPSWSPYKAGVVQEATTFHQHNRWSNNRYVDDWRFTAYEGARKLTSDQWRAAAYNQDGGSAKRLQWPAGVTPIAFSSPRPMGPATLRPAHLTSLIWQWLVGEPTLVMVHQPASPLLASIHAS